jgi:hypothetical protein
MYSTINKKSSFKSKFNGLDCLDSYERSFFIHGILLLIGIACTPMLPEAL